MLSKICTTCGSNKSLPQWYCGPTCNKCYKKGLYQKNKAEILKIRKKYHLLNKETIKKYQRDYGSKNRAALTKREAKWRQAHKERANQYKKTWRDKNLEKVKEYNRLWAKRNKGTLNFRTAKRRAIKIQATPRWLTKTDLSQMKKFYQDCPVNFEVDHIIPLQGSSVRGLHVPWNLQYLSRADNRRKGNRYE